MISIVLNSRNKDNNNDGGLPVFLKRLSDSLYDKSNVEVLVKLDKDDSLGILELLSLNENNFFGISCKFALTDRVYYHGLHIGYKEAFSLRSKDSLVSVCMADDFVFNKPNWDRDLLQELSSRNFTKDSIFTVVDFKTENLDNIPYAPLWSTKMIELCDGFGPTYSTDAWSARINRYLETNIANSVVLFNIGVGRLWNRQVDGPANVERWSKRDEMMAYVKSKEFDELLNNQCKILKEYTDG